MYDETADTYTCPQDQVLRTNGTLWLIQTLSARYITPKRTNITGKARSVNRYNSYPFTEISYL